MRVRLLNHLAVIAALLSTTGIAQEMQVATTAFHPIFDIHVGAGFVGGGRVGVRVRPLEHFSVETGYGASLKNFIGLSDIDKRVVLGINWHEDSSSRLILSLLAAYARRPYLTDNYSYIASANVGTMNMNVGGFRAFARGGLSIEFGHGASGNKVIPGFNLDFGLQLVIP